MDFTRPKKDLLELPAEYAFIGAIAAELMRQAIAFEDELDTWMAQEDDALRDSGWRGEAKIKKQVMLNDTWARKRRKVNKAWAQYMKVKAVMDAMGLKYGVLEKRFQKGSDMLLVEQHKPSLLKRMELMGKTPRSFSKRGTGIPRPSKKETKIYKNEEEEEEEE